MHSLKSNWDEGNLLWYINMQQSVLHICRIYRVMISIDLCINNTNTAYYAICYGIITAEYMTVQYVV
jgi:hypothetical protein